jgi:hypothetical protein
MKKLMFIVVLFLASTSLFSQEYEIAWEKDIGGSYAQFSKDGEFIYLAGGNTISKYRSSDGSFVSTFDYETSQILTFTNNFYLSPSGNFLLTIGALGSEDGNLYIWDLKTEKIHKIINNVKDADMSLDDSKLFYVPFTKSLRSSIITLDLKTNKLSSKIFNDIFSLIKISHSGSKLATASHSSETGGNYYLTLWETESLTEIKRFDLNGVTGIIFDDIKFSWDDKFVGCLTINPYEANIFSTESFKLQLNSKTISPKGSGYVNFTGNNKFILFYYPEWDKNLYNLYFVNRNSNSLEFSINTRCYPLSTSSNNLIFTGTALLKPKIVGVSENLQNRLLISPNPASDYIEINVGVRLALPLLESFEIYNVFGEKNPTLALPVGEGEVRIDISNLAPGVYFIRIGDKFEKFIKL